jgi:hypothetical protein
MNFGLLLTNTMNDKNIIDAKRSFLSKINKYKDAKEKEQDNILFKINYYNNRFQKKREINDETYMNYIQSFTQLKDNWIKSNKENDLEKLKNLKKPDLINVEDIYTYMIIRNTKFKN